MKPATFIYVLLSVSTFQESLCAPVPNPKASPGIWDYVAPALAGAGALGGAWGLYDAFRKKPDTQDPKTGQVKTDLTTGQKLAGVAAGAGVLGAGMYAWNRYSNYRANKKQAEADQQAAADQAAADQAAAQQQALDPSQQAQTVDQTQQQYQTTADQQQQQQYQDQAVAAQQQQQYQAAAAQQQQQDQAVAAQQQQQYQAAATEPPPYYQDGKTSMASRGLTANQGAPKRPSRQVITARIKRWRAQQDDLDAEIAAAEDDGQDVTELHKKLDALEDRINKAQDRLDASP